MMRKMGSWKMIDCSLMKWRHGARWVSPASRIAARFYPGLVQVLLMPVECVSVSPLDEGALKGTLDDKTRR